MPYPPLLDAMAALGINAGGLFLVPVAMRAGADSTTVRGPADAKSRPAPGPVHVRTCTSMRVQLVKHIIVCTPIKFDALCICMHLYSTGGG